MAKKHFISGILLLLIIQLSFSVAFSQTIAPKINGWHLLDPAQNGYLGTGVTGAYDLLKDKKSYQVVIAVIDSGVDTTHEDLKQNLWVNPKEVPGNNLDDDGNGYKDDVHGWNFCGNESGENVVTNSHEITRVYHGWKNEFEGKSENKVSKEKRFLYGQWKKSKKILEEQYEEYLKNYSTIDNISSLLQLSNRLITDHLKKGTFTKNDIALIKTEDSLGRAVNIWLNIFNQGTDASVTNTFILEDIAAYKNTLLNHKKRMEEIPADTRGILTKDNYLDINDKFYGNNNLQTGSGNHGTHVSGIIGAIRNNKKGVDGIVENVKIMIIRAVPGGDEHDKDVALAIRYAVDNGASIINMSFGKPVSPYKQFVDDAIRYAASKKVLLVHGSGNDGEDLDVNMFYPNPVFLDGTYATNMLTIGASGDKSLQNLIAPFSNYSDEIVDIFAPGMSINSTITGNGYAAMDGTSMASPVAAGVAGLIKSYFPELSPEQIIELIIRSGTEIKEEVNIPGKDNKRTSMKNLSKSGKIINAKEAIKLALSLYEN
jgi:subtilisin family serine protease